MSFTCAKLTLKTPEPRHWRISSVFIVNFENISHFVLLHCFVRKFSPRLVKSNFLVEMTSEFKKKN